MKEVKNNLSLYSESVNRKLIRPLHNSVSMAIQSGSAQIRFNRRDSLWLALAVLLHALLLLLPADHFRPAPHNPLTLSVSLPVPRVADPAPVKTADAVSPPGSPSAQAPSPAAEIDAEEERPEPQVTATPSERISAARLIDSIGRIDWSLPEEQEQRRLGVPAPYRVPDNWLPRLRREDNRFDGKTVPARTEIIDRWVAADGSHNMVVETSGGDTICGRAQRWNPMSPLVEPVMMYWKCGGGGRRSFKMPERLLRTR